MEFSDADLDEWTRVVHSLHDYVESRTPDGHLTWVSDRVGRLWSDAGFPDSSPQAVDEMLMIATEAGYLAALDDVAVGEWDAEVEGWLKWRHDGPS